MGALPNNRMPYVKLEQVNSNGKGKSKGNQFRQKAYTAIKFLTIST